MLSSRQSLPTAAIAAVCVVIGFFALPLHAQQPLDLFADVPELSNDFIRIGAWNLRHINLEGDVRDLLPGNNDDEDFAILTAIFAKAIEDLGLDLVAIVEHQPRVNSPNRLEQIRGFLNGNGGNVWLADESNIVYDNPNNQFSGLQFGLLWNSTKITIDPATDQLLLDLRQPRDANGNLVHQRLRAPWLVPVRAGNLEFDLMVLHLKSGGKSPQAAEVEAIRQFITQRQTEPTPRHLIVLGDWNIRPDQSRGRTRLGAMMVPFGNHNLMRILTVEEIPPDLAGWAALGHIEFGSPAAATVPFTHFNARFIDTFLDHVAISDTLAEVFDHPIAVTLQDNSSDIRPGIRIAMPLITEEDYLELTDHLPVVVLLRTTGGGIAGPGALSSVSIVAALPNPPGDDVQFEEVHLRNNTTTTLSLTDWRIGDSTGTQFWILNNTDGTLAPGQTLIIVRTGRPMFLNNSGGDTIVLINASDDVIDTKSYSQNASSGRLFRFD